MIYIYIYIYTFDLHDLGRVHGRVLEVEVIGGWTDLQSLISPIVLICKT